MITYCPIVPAGEEGIARPAVLDRGSSRQSCRRDWSEARAHARPRRLGVGDAEYFTQPSGRMRLPPATPSLR